MAIVLAFLLVAAAGARADETQQYLRDRYQGKTLFLRGFYTGDKLRYDATGAPVSGATSGDWTTDGVVLLNDIHVSGNRITIKARRLLVSVSQGTFHFLAEDPKRQKKSSLLKIEADLGSPNPSPEQADAAISRIFLTVQDTFSELVPDYWKPCIPAGLGGEHSNCLFSPEFEGIPGIAPQGQRNRASAPTSAESGNPQMIKDFRPGRGVSPPRAIFQHEPEFSEPARQAKYQGVVTLGLVVNNEGLPTKVHIVSPLGCGLDAKAVQAVETWRFKPAEKDGQPVPAEIAVEVDFHLY